ncbi:MAG TPA: hypothetical protein VKY92_11555 [Verrucomicrobiae bacterium]|nr:hypothetical protein [Verrucomicrobiae bacterium]
MSAQSPEPNPAPRKKYVRAVGPRLRILLYFIFGSVAILAANSIYLSSITFLEWVKNDPNTTYQNWFYMIMFGSHLVLGFILVLPVVIFGLVHIKNAHNRPNRRAVKVGYLLFATSLVLIVTGLLLTRIDVFQFKNLGLKDPRLRSAAYWAHVITPLRRFGCTCCTGWPGRGSSGKWDCAGAPRLALPFWPWWVCTPRIPARARSGRSREKNIFFRRWLGPPPATSSRHGLS